MSTTIDRSQRRFEKPVAWLLGKQLLGSIKGLLLYTAYGAKLDPRDWMTAEVYEEFVTKEAEDKEDFWFDYLSDAGDGTKAMYSIAYLVLSDLWTKLDKNATQLPTNSADRRVSTTQDGFDFKLRRGEFLFIGGDTAYHSAEYLTLVNRIQKPFKYAYEDLKARNLISDDQPRRPIFGIPGNHDYYDQVDGFRRQFRKPTRPEGPLPPKPSGGAFAQLTLAGFRRVQQASYVAIRLPFKWWLWGLDTESPVESATTSKHNLDRRQQTFFKTQASEDGKPPKKLILATCSPSTVFGRIAHDDDLKVARSMASLKLSVPFLPDKTSNGKPDLKTTGDVKLDEGECRLDLSGDVHHYARYWGPAAPAGSAVRKHNTVKDAAVAKSYASVVSGAGGAFHHPTPTYDDEICEQVLYPPEDVSRNAAAHRLFKFWNVLTGGRVWVAGLIMAFAIFFGATVPHSSRQFLGNVALLNALHLTSPEPIRPTIQTTTGPCEAVEPFWLWTGLGLVDSEWRPPAGCNAQAPPYFFHVSSLTRDLGLGTLFIVAALIATVATLGLTLSKKIFTDDSPFKKGSDPSRILWPLILGTTLLGIVGLFSIKPYRDYIAPFVISLLVLFTIFAAITAIVVSVRYGEYRFKKSFVFEPGDRFLEFTCWLIAAGAVGSGLWFFGKNNLPVYLISDILFTTVLIGGVIGIMYLPFAAAGGLFYTKSKAVRFFGKTVIGIWHLILQLLVAYILIRHGNYITWAVAAVLLFVPIPLAQLLMKKDNRLGLFLLWLVYGAVMLTLPWIVAWVMGLFGIPYAPVFSNFTGWIGLLAALLAAGFGAVLACLWTGWYFAVCFVFNGHNNEVGGAARIEEFKEFIRFRLTRQGLTGYVIAVDDVSKVGEVDSKGHVFDGSDLNVKLIDVFHLVPKQGSANPASASSE